MLLKMFLTALVLAVLVAYPLFSAGTHGGTRAEAVGYYAVVMVEIAFGVWIIYQIWRKRKNT